MNDYDIKLLKLKEAEKPQPLTLKQTQNNVIIYEEHNYYETRQRPQRRNSWLNRPYTPTINYYVEDYIDSGDGPDWMMTAITFIGISVFLGFLLVMCIGVMG